DDGLPNNRVEAILQDRRGFMWFGTTDGLARYDGYRVVTYKHLPDNPNSLSNNIVTALAEDTAGALWVGTRPRGPNRLDLHTHSFTRYHASPENAQSLADNSVTALALDADGTLWVGTANRQLHRFEPAVGTFRRYLLAPCGRPASVEKIVPSPSGGLWVL